MKKKSIILTITVFLLLFSTLLFSLFSFYGEKESKKFRVGIVNLTSVDRLTMQGFKDKLSEFGMVENKNITYYYDKPAENITNLKDISKKMRDLNLNLVFVSSTPATLEVKNAFKNSSTPIIFSPVNDPVGSGIIKSLNEQNRTITGVKLAKGDDLRLKWLKELSPKIKRVYLPYTIGDKSALATLENIKKVALKFEIVLITEGIDELKPIEELIDNIPDDIDAIFIPRDTRIENKIKSFVELSIERKIPLSAPSCTQVEKGALFSYGHNHYEIGKQAGRIASQILKGELPSDLPIEISENYLVINILTAKKIGLKIPTHILKQAIIIREDKEYD